MARRSGSSRWSRPATSRQIASLKASGNYDGKYYSVGRASQIIGNSASRGAGRRSGHASAFTGTGSFNFGGASAGPPRIAPAVFGIDGDLGSALGPALGARAGSALLTSESGPAATLAEVLGVPDNLDALLAHALAADESSSADDTSSQDPIESVSFTVRSDEGDPAEPRVLIDAEVVRDSGFDGAPSVQVRFVDSEQAANQGVSGRAGGRTLGYRPAWTPVLVRTPKELAAQMRLHWRDALDALKSGGEPGLTLFLARSDDMAVAVSVLGSAQTPTAKFILLQGLLDPEAPITFEGVELDAQAFAQQIRAASDGDDDALTWLESVLQERVLTSYAEVTGISIAAEADFLLKRWQDQAEALIHAVTDLADPADPANRFFTLTRSISQSNSELRASKEKFEADLKAKIDEATSPEQRAGLERIHDQIVSDLEDLESEDDEHLLEDWFFEEMREFLRTRLREAVPGMFALALSQRSDLSSSEMPLAESVKVQATEASTEPAHYTSKSVTEDGTVRVPRSDQRWGESSIDHGETYRLERMIQAIAAAMAHAESTDLEDVGTLVVVREILVYAAWRKAAYLEKKLARRVEENRRLWTVRKEHAEKQARASNERDKDGAAAIERVQGLEAETQLLADRLTSKPASGSVRDPFPESLVAEAMKRLEQASQREGEAKEWLAAAEERRYQADLELKHPATLTVREMMAAELDEASTELREATVEHQSARSEVEHLTDELETVRKARGTSAILMRPIIAENNERVRVEQELQEQEAVRRRDEAHARVEAERARRAEALKKQEEENRQQHLRATRTKEALKPMIESLLALPSPDALWRRTSRAAKRTALEQQVLAHQRGIAAPLHPPRAGSREWPAILATSEIYLGVIKKVVDYGAFASLPAGVDGLIRRTDLPGEVSKGDRIVVKIVEMPPDKPIILKPVVT